MQIFDGALGSSNYTTLLTTWAFAFLAMKKPHLSMCSGASLPIFLCAFFKVCSGPIYLRTDTSKPVCNLQGGVSSILMIPPYVQIELPCFWLQYIPLILKKQPVGNIFSGVYLHS
jgi:hypothetical protein